MRGRRRRDDPPERPSSPPRLAALRLLGRRDYTRHELTAALVAKGYGADEVEAAVADLASERIVDDTRVAEAHVRTASRVKRRGPLRIRRELEARGVSATLAGQAMEAVAPEEAMEMVRAFIARKQGQAPLDLAARRRLFQQLLRRGFPADLIGKALRYRPDEE